MTKYFRRNEIEIILSYLEGGIVRGSFNYLIFLVINMVADLHEILKEIAFNASIDEDKRNFCFWLYMHVAKLHSINDTLKTADDYLIKFPFGLKDEALMGIKESIEKGELCPIG
ncbi:hypothetical protein [Flavobacterium geliluteum]|uniref:Uncharacterized protein n=3 Tax=Flavobacterium TaxID=237 RepID=A0A940XHA9_9FLAO|nr:hypothetical protein [Flavobacterium geliluteum]MBP4139790.1 hypothetical protein [Flavobacterium geliluteum]